MDTLAGVLEVWLETRDPQDCGKGGADGGGCSRFLAENNTLLCSCGVV